MCMRTNLVLNDELLAEARKYSRSGTKRGLVEEALTVFIRTKASEQKTLSYQSRVQELEKKISGIKLREAPLKILRDTRERS